MRYDTEVYFRLITAGAYDPATGDYEADTFSEDKKLASVMDTTEQVMRLVYGGIRQGSLTIQLQNHYKQPFDELRIGEQRYAVDYRRRLRTKDTFVVSEVQ